MKPLFLTLLIVVFTSGCAAQINMTTTDPITGNKVVLDFKSARRTAITVAGTDVTVITGQVAIDDATVQALGKGAENVISQAYRAGVIDGQSIQAAGAANKNR